jgi:hypothetical protein
VTEIAAAGDAPSARTADVTTMRTIDRIGDRLSPTPDGSRKPGR